MGSKSIAQLSALLQNGALDPVALMEETFAAIESHSDQTIFTYLLKERAGKEAEASRRRIREGRSLGVLDGIPIAWKDLFAVEGLPTTAGSQILQDTKPEVHDAAVVRALTAAGTVSVGRVNMSEFAFSGLGINPHFGTPRNPASPEGENRLPGGSSSGSAVAVAAGLVPASIGTDTSGSVRIPAAFNGVVGYKATRGRYSMEGVFPLAESLDSLGPLCRTVQDAIWLDAAMRNVVSTPVARPSLSDISFIIPDTVMFDDAEPEVVEAFELSGERLARAGARIRREALPEFTEIFELMAKYGSLVTAEAYHVHRTRLASSLVEQMDPRVVKRTLLGKNVSLSDYLEVLAARKWLMASFKQRLGPDAILLNPTLPHVACPAEPLLKDDELFFKVNAKTLRNTLICNFLDGCAISLPCGVGSAGLPVGLQLSASGGADDRVLAVAAVVEQLLR